MKGVDFVREVDRIEVITMHCIWCGAKNKIKTDYGTKKDGPVGFTLRCCNCGHMDIFNRNWSKPMDLYTKKYQVLDMRCIREHTCDRKECPLWTTNPMKIKPPNDGWKQRDYDMAHGYGLMIHPKPVLPK